NDLLTQLGDMGRESNGNFVQSFFASTGGSDNYAKLTYARQLVEDRDFTVNRRLGYISLMYPLNHDQELSVAYRYVANGREYQVGEFSTDIAVRPSQPKKLYTKLLKNETLKTDMRTSDVMMKNLYSLNATQVSENNSFMRI